MHVSSLINLVNFCGNSASMTINCATKESPPSPRVSRATSLSPSYCVISRERERKKERQKERKRECVCVCLYIYICIYVCTCISVRFERNVPSSLFLPIHQSSTFHFYAGFLECIVTKLAIRASNRLPIVCPLQHWKSWSKRRRRYMCCH